MSFESNEQWFEEECARREKEYIKIQKQIDDDEIHELETLWYLSCL